MSRILRDALILALIPVAAAAFALFEWNRTASPVALLFLPLAALAFSLFEWGGITDAPWHTISKYAQLYRWLYWLIALLPFVVIGMALAHQDLLIIALTIAATIIFEAWWHRHIFDSFIPRLRI